MVHISTFCVFVKDRVGHLRLACSAVTKAIHRSCMRTSCVCMEGSVCDHWIGCSTITRVIDCSSHWTSTVAVKHTTCDCRRAFASITIVVYRCTRSGTCVAIKGTVYNVWRYFTCLTIVKDSAINWMVVFKRTMANGCKRLTIRHAYVNRAIIAVVAFKMTIGNRWTNLLARLTTTQNNYWATLWLIYISIFVGVFWVPVSVTVFKG